MVSQTAPGTKVDLKIIREGRGRSIDVTLDELTAEQVADSGRGERGALDAHDGLDGVVVDDLTSQVRRELGIPNRLSGAVVAQVDRSSNAYDAGLRRGDVIVEINQAPVEDADDAVELSEAARGDQILLRVWSRSGGRAGLRFLAVDNTKDE